MKLNLYQTCLAGYDGGTDETDDLVRWIAAPTKEIAEAYCDRAGWTGRSLLEEINPVQVDSDETGEAINNGVDVILDESGEVIGRRTLNRYRHCAQEWEDTWDSACNDKCPVCDAEIEPYESEMEGEE